jgi:dTDP-glucose 4,6-dehydratase
VNNLTIIKEILEIMNKSSDQIEFIEDRPGHDFRYSLDSSKIRNETDWSPKTEFHEGLKKTVEWYLQNKEWWSKINESEYRNPSWEN